MLESDTARAAAWAACIATIVAFQFVMGGRKWKADGLRVARRQDLHLQRRAQHALTGGMIYTASGFFPVEADIFVLFACALAFYVLHGMRRRHKWVDKMYLELFHGLLRREEINRSVLPGAFYFLVGCGAVLALFPKDLARLAILHLSVGDPAASLVGALYGRRRKALGGKSIEGFVGCLVVSGAASFFAVSAPYFPFFMSIDAHSLTKATFAGLCAAVAECVDLGWDDNLTLPVLSAALLTLGRMGMQIA